MKVQNTEKTKLKKSPVARLRLPSPSTATASKVEEPLVQLLSSLRLQVLSHKVGHLVGVLQEKGGGDTKEVRPINHN